MKPQKPDDIIKAILDAVKASAILPSRARLEPTHGTITESWISKTSMPHGAALLALTGFTKQSHQTEGTQVTECELGFFLFSPQVKASKVAEALADQAFQLTQFIDRNTWGLRGAKWPTHIKAKNAFSPTLLDKQSGLWIIDWKQNFIIAEDQIDAIHEALFGEEARNG